MNKLLLLLGIGFIIPFALFAQNNAIKGKVTDQTGNPLTGVNITIQGSKRGYA